MNTINGFANILKPAGITSFKAVTAVKRALPKKTKIGHAGTLDPDTTGVLPIAIGKATRLVEYIMEQDKCYEGEITFGIATDTQDSSGVIIQEKDASNLSKKSFLDILPAFTGDILQVPPMVSALKYKGQPLYKLAREGKEIPREPRPVKIFSITVLETKWQQKNPSALLNICCSKGTYIRTLFNDIGKDLKVGAHMSALKRLSSGTFTWDKAIHLDQAIAMLENQKYDFILPMSYPLENWATLILEKPAEINKICHGNDLVLPDNYNNYIDNKSITDHNLLHHNLLKIEDKTGSLLAIGKIIQKNQENILKVKKVFQPQ